MELRLAIFFVFLYYIRPQDWVAGMAGFNIMRPMIAIWFLAMWSNRERTEPRRVMVTPHDWLMLIYMGYVVWTSPDSNGTFKGFFPLVVFYAFTVQSLTSWEAVLSYLKGWNYMLLGLAGMAVASLYGFDLTGAAFFTEQNLGRLCIGTWMHDNPNALGHSVIAILPLSFLLYFWRGNFMGRFVIFPAHCALAFYCVYETESKGAFLVGGGLFVLLFVVGRPLIVKLFAVAFAATMGVSALAFLPRMSDMGNLRADEGVQGRLMAWEIARTTVDSYATGVGWKQFVAYINWFGVTEKKATHAAYVKVAADLGIYGLALYLAGIWASFRSAVSVFRFTREDETQERCRRIVLVLIAGYVASSWMINREYHTEYFLIIALAGALHRLSLQQEADEAEEDEHEEKENAEALDQAVGEAVDGDVTVDAPRGAVPVPVPAPGVRVVGERVLPALPDLPTEEEAAPPQKKLWNRLAWSDVAACAALTWLVIYVWDYILKNL